MSTNEAASTVDNKPKNAVGEGIADNQPITIEELLRLKDECLAKIRQEELYRLRNDAKIRAVYSSQSYDEFKDIVDAAHLKAVSKTDKMDASTRNRLWNSAAHE